MQLTKLDVACLVAISVLLSLGCRINPSDKGELYHDPDGGLRWFDDRPSAKPNHPPSKPTATPNHPPVKPTAAACPPTTSCRCGCLSGKVCKCAHGH